MTTSTAARSVTVTPLSARSELLLVVRAAMVIAVGVWMYVAATASGAGGGAAGTSARNLLPYQKLVADRPFAEQRMFRELQEGLVEAEASRSTNGSWPDAAALADNGIPPFATDPTRRSSYTWSTTKSGTIVNYLGLPANPNEPAWLLLIQEPEPGVPPDQNFEDEEHNRLASGAMLHVSTWLHANGAAIGQRIVRLPQAEGWTQIYAVGPAARQAPPARP
ncbi:MAG TPA: hypothetical protein VH583_09535 [Vicinamibacterales bacterium]|jgi:hypothetical protein